MKLTRRNRHARITEARRALGRAHLDLARELQEACPGRHQYGRHADGQWCCHCGYDRHGILVRTTPCVTAELSTDAEACK